MILYHYTSINSLSLILKNRTMKFNRLDLVNDPLDGFSSDFSDAKKTVFVCCFTARKDDSLPMWSMYTRDMRGVRIGFSSDLFGQVQTHRFEMDLRHRKIDSLNEEQSMLAGPDKVEYLPTTDEINSHIIKDLGHAKSFDTFKIGKYKLIDWQFEQEYRFKLFSLPKKFGALIKYGSYDKMIKEMQNEINHELENIYVDIEHNVFDKTQILLGPRTDDSDMLIVQALINSYAPEISIVEKSKKKVN